MQYVRIDTDDGEVRWINLDQISRVTLAKEAPTGNPILVITFADTSPQARLTIQATSDANRKAIDKITSAVDALANSSGTK